MGEISSDPLMRYPAWQKHLESIKAGEPPRQSGAMGVLQSALDSPIGRTAMKPLIALGAPGRGVISALREGVDSFDGNPETSASFSDWWGQTNDATFGFGTAFDIDTGSKWLDRAIGFFGDVALDPLTYVTLGSSGVITSASGRIATGARYLADDTIDAGLDFATKAAKAQRIASKGVGLLGDSERAALGLNPRGLYFGWGKAMRPIKVGGYRAGKGLARVLEPSLNNIRFKLVNGPRWMRRAASGFVPQDAKAARQALMRGELNDPNMIRDAFNLVTSRNTERLARSKAEMALTRQVREQIVADMEDIVKADNGQVMRILEGKETAQGPIASVAEKTKIYLKEVYDTVLTYRRALLGDDATLPERRNYFPRVRTWAGNRWALDNPEDAKRLFGFTENQVTFSPHFTARELGEGDDWFGVILTRETANDTDYLNSVARKALNGQDFFETNIVRVLDSYNKSVAAEIGELVRLKEMAERGTGGPMTRKLKPTASAKNLATEKAKLQRAETLSAVEEAERAILDILEMPMEATPRVVDGQVVEGGPKFVESVERTAARRKRAAARVAQMPQRLAELETKKQALLVVLKQQDEELEKLIAKFTRETGAGGSLSERNLEAAASFSPVIMEKIQEIQRIQQQLKTAMIEFESVNASAIRSAQEYTALDEQILSAGSQVREVKKALNNLYRDIDALNLAYDVAIRTKTLTDVGRFQQFLEIMSGKTASRPVMVVDETTGEMVEKVLPFEQSSRKLADKMSTKSRYGKRGWLKDIAASLISEKSLSKVTDIKVREVMQALLAGQASARDMARVAAVLLAFDEDVLRAGVIEGMSAEELASGFVKSTDSAAAKELKEAIAGIDGAIKSIRSVVVRGKKLRGVDQASLQEIETGYQRVIAAIEAIEEQIDEVDNQLYELSTRKRMLDGQMDSILSLGRLGDRSTIKIDGRNVNFGTLRAERDKIVRQIEDLHSKRRVLQRGGEDFAAPPGTKRTYVGRLPLHKQRMEYERLIKEKEAELGLSGSTWMLSTETGKKVGAPKVNTTTMRMAQEGLDAARKRLAFALEHFYIEVQARAIWKDLTEISAEYDIVWNNSVFEDIIRNVFKERAAALGNVEEQMMQARTLFAGLQDVMGRQTNLDDNTLELWLNRVVEISEDGRVTKTIRDVIQERSLSAEIGTPLGAAEVSIWGQQASRAATPASLMQRTRKSGQVAGGVGGQVDQALVRFVDEFDRARQELTRAKRELAQFDSGNIPTPTVDPNIKPVTVRQMTPEERGVVDEVAKAVQAINAAKEAEEKLIGKVRPSRPRKLTGTARNKEKIAQDAADVTTELDQGLGATTMSRLVLEEKVRVAELAAREAEAAAIEIGKTQYKQLAKQGATMRDVIRIVRGPDFSSTLAAQSVADLLTAESKRGQLAGRIESIIGLYDTEIRTIRGIRRTHEQSAVGAISAEKFGFYAPAQRVTPREIVALDNLMRELFGYRGEKTPLRKRLKSHTYSDGKVEFEWEDIPGSSPRMKVEPGAAAELARFVKKHLPILENYRFAEAEHHKISELLRAIRIVDDEEAERIFGLIGFTKKQEARYRKIFTEGRTAYKALQDTRVNPLRAEAEQAMENYHVLRHIARFSPDPDVPEHQFTQLFPGRDELTFTPEEFEALYYNGIALQRILFTGSPAEKEAAMARLALQQASMEKFERLKNAVDELVGEAEEVNLYLYKDGNNVSFGPKKSVMLPDGRELFAVRQIRIAGKTKSERLQSFMDSVFAGSTAIAHPRVLQANLIQESMKDGVLARYGLANPMGLTSIDDIVEYVGRLRAQFSQDFRRLERRKQDLIASYRQAREKTIKSTLSDFEKKKSLRTTDAGYRDEIDKIDIEIRSKQKHLNALENEIKRINDVVKQRSSRFQSRIRTIDEVWDSSAEKSMADVEMSIRNSDAYQAVFGDDPASLISKQRELIKFLHDSIPETIVRELVEKFKSFIGSAQEAEQLLGGSDAIRRLYDTYKTTDTVALDGLISAEAANAPTLGQKMVSKVDEGFNIVRQTGQRISRAEEQDADYMRVVAAILGYRDARSVKPGSSVTFVEQLEEFSATLKSVLDRQRKFLVGAQEYADAAALRKDASERAVEMARRRFAGMGAKKQLTTAQKTQALRDAAMDGYMNPEKYPPFRASTSRDVETPVYEAGARSAQATAARAKLQKKLDKQWGTAAKETTFESRYGNRLEPLDIETAAEKRLPANYGVKHKQRKELARRIIQLREELYGKQERLQVARQTEVLRADIEARAPIAAVQEQRAPVADALSRAQFEFSLLTQIGKSVTEDVVADLNRSLNGLTKALNLRGGKLKPLAKGATTQQRWARINAIIEMYDALNGTRAVLNLPEGHPLKAAMIHAQHKINKMLVAEEGAMAAEVLLGQAARGEWHGKIVYELDKGMKELQQLTGYQIPEHVERWMTQFKMMDSKQMQGFWRFVNDYTRFFKGYATFSPGFHVRNAISNMFVLMASGSDMGIIRDGLRVFFSDFREDFERGLAAHADDKYGKAMEIALAAGFRGRFDELSNFFVTSRLGERINDNRALNWAARIGGDVEGSAKFALALDSVEKGLDFDQAVARVNKFLFDYQDVGTADEAIRRVVPFWMFMSRNLPLTLTNQWMNPRAYSIYDKIVKNFSEEDDDMVVPAYMREIGAFRVGQSTFITPDLGFTRLPQDVAMITDPTRFAANVNPLFRVIPELMGSRKWFNDAQFSDQPIELTGQNALYAPLLAIAGQTETVNGKTYAKSDRGLYAIQSFIPTASVAGRIAPPEGFDAMALARWMGVPVRQISEEQQRRELARRRKNLEEEIRRKKRML